MTIFFPRRYLAGTRAVALSLSLGAGALESQTSTGARPATGAQHAAAHDSAAVVSVIDRFHAALAAGDSATAMSLLAPDAVILESGGMETRAEYQSHHLPGDMAYAKAMTSTRGPVRVMLRGDVAWVATTSRTTGELRGRQVNSLGAELVVLTRTGGSWQISAIHWSARNQRPPTG